nr:MAG TPA: hypothetical protein [Caudoviricetes sp.]
MIIRNLCGTLCRWAGLDRRYTRHQRGVLNNIDIIGEAFFARNKKKEEK